jgi:hypothetical protein
MMMAARYRLVFALMSVITLLAGCQRNLPVESLPSGMMIPANATNVRSVNRPDGAVELTYRAKEPYPATNLLSEVRRPLSGEGWRELTEDWLTPGLPVGATRGWTNVEDASKQPSTLLHQWSGAWVDGQGNLLWLIVRYRSAPRHDMTKWLDPPDNADATVRVLWIPARSVETTRRAAGATGPLK